MKLLIRIFTLILSSFFFLGCSNTSPPDHGTIAATLMYEFAKEARIKHGYLYQGGGGEMMYDVKKLCMFFVDYHECTIDEARPKILELENELLDKINNNNEIKPCLHNYPFTQDDISITLSFYDKRDQDYVDKPYVANVLCTRGKIYYEYSLRTPKGFKPVVPECEEALVETIEEAQAKLASQSKPT